MRKRNAMFIALLALTTVSCSQKGGSKSGFGDNEYAVCTAAAQDASLETAYPATIKGVHDVQIRPKVSGFITKVCVREGQTVKAGQVLFVIDNETYQAQVRQSRAAVNTAKAQLATARLTMENSLVLHKNNVIGDYELATARNNHSTAEAALQQAEAALASANEALSFCYVKSPADGVIGSLPYKTGALVSASGGMPLTTVSDISSIEAYFSVTEKDMLDMTKSRGGIDEAIAGYPPVRLLLADGTEYAENGKVIKASGVIDEPTGTITLIARFENPKKLLRSGGAGTIAIRHNSGDAIVVPQEAATEIQNKKFVYLVDKDNRVKYTEIKVLPQNDGINYIVTSGMKAGDRYVSKGIAKLADGMKITPITEEQYFKKIDDAAKLGESQASSSDFIKAMKQ